MGTTNELAEDMRANFACNNFIVSFANRSAVLRPPFQVQTCIANLHGLGSKKKNDQEEFDGFSPMHFCLHYSRMVSGRSATI